MLEWGGGNKGGVMKIWARGVVLGRCGSKLGIRKLGGYKLEYWWWDPANSTGNNPKQAAMDIRIAISNGINLC